MSKLGTARTKKFQIGTAELRVGPLSLANKLTQAHSVGLVDNVTFEISQETVDLEGGFPKVLIDSVVSRQISGVTATTREFSRRNIQLMMGEGVEASEPVDADSTMVNDGNVGTTSISVSPGEGSKFTADTIVVVYDVDDPARVTVARIESISTDTLSLSADTPLLHSYLGTTQNIKVYVAHPIAIGGVSNTKYFAAQLVQLENATGRPIVINFWKCSTGAGMSYGTNADDFASSEMNIKTLVPAASEYASGADLEHLASIINANPTGMFVGGADS